MRHRHLRAAAALLTAAVTACRTEPPERYGFVATLGRDTVSVERVERRGARLTIDGVDRFPRVRARHTEVALAADGSVRDLTMQIDTPSEPDAQRHRTVEARVTPESVHIAKRDSSGTVTRDFTVSRALVVAHVPQMYSLYDLYFQAAHRRARAAREDTVPLRQFYIDREFDRFSMHNATVHLRANDSAEIWHDWLAGIGDALLDSAGRLVGYSGRRTTYKVEVHRLTAPPDIAPIAARFAALESRNGGARALSVRDTARGRVGTAELFVDYGRPLMRGRALLGELIPYDQVWRTGANAATQFVTAGDVMVGGIHVPAGTYTLWTIPRRDGGADLIVNRQSGQWGTSYDERQNLGTTRMPGETLGNPIEQFTITIRPAGAQRGTLAMAWGTFQWTAEIQLAPSSTKRRGV